MKSTKITTLNQEAHTLNQLLVTAQKYNDLKDDFDTLRPSDTALTADTISEVTSATGVTVDGVLLKDSDVTAGEVFLATPYVTAGTGVTKEERGDGRNVTVTLSFTDLVLGAPTAGGNSAHGAILCTLPNSNLLLTAISCKIALTVGTTTTDTPDVGLGTVIATGAQALLSATATWEDIITGQTYPDCAGTNDYFGTVFSGVVTDATTVPLIKSAGAGTKIHLNAADGWAAGVTGNLTATGYVVINFLFVV